MAGEQKDGTVITRKESKEDNQIEGSKGREREIGPTLTGNKPVGDYRPGEMPTLMPELIPGNCDNNFTEDIMMLDERKEELTEVRKREGKKNEANNNGILQHCKGIRIGEGKKITGKSKAWKRLAGEGNQRNPPNQIQVTVIRGKLGEESPT
ncbi:hypothetical protein ACH5RR_014899 [Cinchona calisaya]|uniref:Uncharacterized protein n=1 Tax=Cinchona calisaya TaxID=153742 RepID=A0ABD2ZRL5_9GENT